MSGKSRLARFSTATWLLSLGAAWLAISTAALADHGASQDDWSCYGRDPGGARYSPLEDINTTNVARLKLAWTFQTGELERVKKSPLAGKVAFEATPLAIGGTLFFSTATARVFALDGASGRELWNHDARLKPVLAFAEGASRGVSFWKSSGEPVQRRLFMGTLDGRCIAIDADTGQACDDFGRGGSVDLVDGLPRAVRGLYGVTSPPAIVGDTVIIGSSIGDNGRFDAASGVVRALDARSGKILWTWDPIPRAQGDDAAGTWRGPLALQTGAANVWSIISADRERGLVFLPTSCPSPDFYGGNRLGDNLYANSLVALDARTGKRVWHFQVVHHDIWDYDIAAQPVLFSLKRGGKPLPAVAVGTKTGQVFVLARETGQPLFEVHERAVPKSDVPGEETSPTQPFSALPPLGLVQVEPWGPDQSQLAAARQQLGALRYEGPFTPPSQRGSIVAPSNVGGINWSGMAVDSERQLLVTNVNRLATEVRLIPRAEFGGAGGSRLGEELAPQSGTPFGMARRILRLAESRLPASKPPWGTLAAVDLASGRLRWEVPLGHVIDPAAEPRAIEWGSPNLGGAICTAGGLTFVAASLDGHLRAFESETGRELWRAKLPAGGQATPMTYRAGGKQYVVIAAGGHARFGSQLGDYVVGFSLP